MIQSNAVSSPTAYAMLSLCVLSVGFMIRFLIALAIDGKKIRVDYPVRLKGVRRPADLPCEELPSSEGAIFPTAHLAMGVVRLASALSSTPNRSMSPRSLGGDGNLVPQTNTVIDIDRARVWA